MKIKLIEEAKTKKGEDMWYITFEDGKRYGWFMKPEVKVGDDVTCNLKENGKFTNLIGMYKNDQPQVEQIKVTGSPQVGTQSIIMNKTLQPHSYETGKAGSRHKIYYDSIEQLQAHLVALQDVGLIDQNLDAEEVTI